MNRKQKISLYAMILPSAIGFLVFSLIPYLHSMIISFFDGTGLSNFVWFEQYLTLFKSKSFLLALWNTLKFVFAAIPLQLSIAMLLALWLQQAGRFSQILKNVLFMPFVVPSICIGVVFGNLFAIDGWINQLFKGAVDYLNSCGFWIGVLVFLWKNTGFILIFLLQGLHSIPVDIYDSFTLDSTSKSVRFCRVTLPLIMPTIWFTLMFAVIQVLKIFRDIYLIFGKYPPSDIYMLQHFMNNSFLNLEYGKLTSAAFTLSFIIVVLVFGMSKMHGRVSR